MEECTWHCAGRKRMVASTLGNSLSQHTKCEATYIPESSSSNMRHRINRNALNVYIQRHGVIFMAVISVMTQDQNTHRL
jgi:hypothetical protein